MIRQRAPRGSALAVLWLCALCMAMACAEPPVQGKAGKGPGARPDVVNLVWFGHSLVQRGGEPAVDLPRLVDDLHRAARAAGRSSVPESATQAFVLQQRHLGDHLAGDARAQLRASRAHGATHVIGIGYMHMLGQRSFEHASLTYWLSRLQLASADSPRFHTEHIYRFIELMRTELPGATWVNYVGPALAHNVAPQPAIDARHACIANAAERTGDRVLNAHVGQAFRRAEQRARAENVPLSLQLSDGLHLSAQGAVLAASVIYQSIYGVDVVGLPVPQPYRDALAPTAEAQARVTQLLQETARDTVRSYRPACTTSLPEDGDFLARARGMAQASQ